MLPMWKRTLTRKVQRIFWIYLHYDFVINSMNDFKTTDAGVRCRFVPVTVDNYCRVREFREEQRITEYREKHRNGEVGFFAECDGRLVGSIWATINRTRVRSVVRMYMPLMPNEALIHDIVTAESFRGMGVGPFMVSRMALQLLSEYGVNRIIIDVSSRNRPSLRMMEKVGLEAREKVFSVSLFSTLAYHKTLRTLSHAL